MEYLVEDIVRDVKVCLDENVDSTALALLGDADTLTLDDIIESKIADAARLVESGAAHHLLDRGEPFGDNIWWQQAPGYGMGMIQLPDDFLRLVTYRMSDWAMPVTEAITEEDPRYAMQSSRYGGVRGNPWRPVVAIVQHPTGLMLEFYTCQAGAGVVINAARYIPMPRISGGKIKVCEKLYRAIIYRTASLTALALKDGDAAAAMLATSNNLADITTE